MTDIKEQVGIFLKQCNLPYKDKGKWFQLSCPFAYLGKHKNKDKRPSFGVLFEKDLCKCFGCGYKSNTHDFFKNYSDGKDLGLDLRFFETFVPPVVKEKERPTIILDPSILDCFSKDLTKVNKYLLSRNIDPEYLDIDLYHDTRNNFLVVPIYDVHGNLTGAEGRHLTGKRHYKYFGMENSKCLANNNKIGNEKLLIAEGLTDLLNGIYLNNKIQAGFNIWSTLTANLTDWHAKEIVRQGKPTYLGYDMDTKGKDARYKALRKLDACGCFPLINCTWSNPDVDLGNMSEDNFKKVFMVE